MLYLLTRTNSARTINRHIDCWYFHLSVYVQIHFTISFDVVCDLVPEVRASTKNGEHCVYGVRILIRSKLFQGLYFQKPTCASLHVSEPFYQKLKLTV